SGDPVGGSPIYAYANGKLIASDRTDDSGTYLIEGIAPGPIDAIAVQRLEGRPPGKRVCRKSVHVLGDDVTTVDFVVGEGTRLEGRLTDPSGAPICSHHVVAYADGLSKYASESSNIGGAAYSDATGRFAIPNL